MKCARVFIMMGVLAGLFSADFALAEIKLNEKISLDGTIRYRLEIDGRDFDSETGMYDYSYLRTMLGFTAKASEKVTLRIKFKESRYLGTTGSNKKSTGFIDLQEGYILTQEFIGFPFDFQLGRYEMLFGRRRIIGNGAWNNFGPRTFDGFRLIFKGEKASGVFFYAKIIERSFEDQTPYTGDDFSASDRHLFGVNFELYGGKLEPLVIVDWDSRNDTEHSDLMITPAIYGKYHSGNIKIDADAGYQFGKKNDADLNAWLLAADLNYVLDTEFKPLIGVGMDVTSGTTQEEILAGEDHTFYTPFMSRHRFKGYMDYYQDVTGGLFDMIFRLGFSPAQKAILQLDIHNFRSMAAKSNSIGEEYYQLGQEVDLRLLAPLAKGLNLDGAVCAYFASDDWQPSGDPGYFTYIALIGSF